MSRCIALTLDELNRHPLPPIVEGDKNQHGRLLVIAGTFVVVWQLSHWLSLGT